MGFLLLFYIGIKTKIVVTQETSLSIQPINISLSYGQFQLANPEFYLSGVTKWTLV